MTLYVIVANLSLILCNIGNQWRDERTGEMWSLVMSIGQCNYSSKSAVKPLQFGNVCS